MEVFKYKINLEDSTSRANTESNWGVMTADTFYLNVFLTQSIDDAGLFTDTEYIPAPFLNQIPENASETDLISIRYPGTLASDYYNYGGQKITGFTDSKIDELISYNRNEKFITNFDIDKQTYVNFSGETINGVNRVITLGEPSIYVFDTPNNNLIGTTEQKDGLLYYDYSGLTRSFLIDDELFTIPVTTVSYIGQGKNETNISLSALTKEEYLFGITTTPTVDNDILIDRGNTSVTEKHLKLSEIKNLAELTRYENGFFNVKI